MRRALCLAGLLTLLAAPAAGHGTSKSYAEVRVAGRGVQVRVSFAVHDLAAATPGLDADGDGRVMPAELEAAAEDLGRRLAGELTVTAGAERPEAPCPPGPAETRGLGSPVEEVQAELQYTCPTRVGAVRFAARFLPELEPPHLSVATFVGPGVDATHVFSVDAPETTLRFEAPSLSAELAIGARRVLQGLLTPAAALMLLAVAFAGRRGGPLLVGLFAVGAAAAAGAPGLDELRAAQVLGLLAGAALCAWSTPQWARAPWALAVGALTGWGVAAGLADAEAPVRLAARAVALLVAAALAGVLLAAAGVIAGRGAAARTAAAAVAAGAVALGFLGA